MNLGMMCNYIRFCADWLLLSLGCGRHYIIGNPFEWMETISLQGKTNFFEKRVGEYSKSGVGVDPLTGPTNFCSSWNTHIPALVLSWGFTEKQLHRV
jgi:hypothetical protein